MDDTELRVGFPTPAEALQQGAGLQEFRILLRKDAAGGNDPTYDIELWETGGSSPLATLADGVTLSSDTGEVVSMTWDASLLAAADGSAVEVRVFGDRSNGNPSVRRTVEVGAIEWVAATTRTEQAGLYYLRARYYDPETGRFMSRDPLAANPAWRGHKFSYANAHPTDLSDPTGLDPEREPEGIAFPPPGSLEDQGRCRDGWIHCLFEIGDEREFRKLTPFEISDACRSFYKRCMDRVANGEEGYFEFDAVRERMRSMINGPNIIDDIIDLLPEIPRLPIRPPDTGSGGLRQATVRADKEGSSFLCLR